MEESREVNNSNLAILSHSWLNYTKGDCILISLMCHWHIWGILKLLLMLSNRYSPWREPKFLFPVAMDCQQTLSCSAGAHALPIHFGMWSGLIFSRPCIFHNRCCESMCKTSLPCLGNKISSVLCCLWLFFLLLPFDSDSPPPQCKTEHWLRTAAHLSTKQHLLRRQASLMENEMCTKF